MKTNAFGQRLRDDAPTLPSDNYNGEFFNAPIGGIKGHLFDGPHKVYSMGYLEGQPHILVESYYSSGVTVSYLISGVTYSWAWRNRQQAWDWAKDRNLHIKALR